VESVPNHDRLGSYLFGNYTASQDLTGFSRGIEQSRSLVETYQVCTVTLFVHFNAKRFFSQSAYVILIWVDGELEIEIELAIES
jgi:hypothetical protein